MGGFCLLVELEFHWEGSARSLQSRLVFSRPTGLARQSWIKLKFTFRAPVLVFNVPVSVRVGIYRVYHLTGTPVSTKSLFSLLTFKSCSSRLQVSVIPSTINPGVSIGLSPIT